MSRPFGPALDGALDHILSTLDIPSAAAVAVKGEDVFTKTYGQKRIGEPAAIGPDTVFIIASCSKSFCGALAACLVDEGVVDWDERICETVPEFVLGDPWVTKNIKLRDVLGMRSGLKREGFCEYGFNATGEADAYFHYMREVAFEAGFRETFTYSNAGYAAAATLFVRKAGRPYSDLIRERIFEPAGMRSAVSRRGRLGANPDHFYPHVRLKDEVIALPEPVSVGWEGSTAVYLSANDTARWLRLQLGDGEIDGRRVISDAAIAETRKPHAIDAPGKLTGERFSLYAMGWQAFDHHGRVVYRHTGGELGSSTFTMFCPEAQVGVACYVSLYSSAAVACGYAMLDALLGVPAQDYARIYGAMLNDRVRAAVEDVETRFPADPDKARRTSLKNVKGRYRSAIFGEAEITHENGRLRIEFEDRPMLSAELVPVGDDVFDIRHDYVGMEQELYGAYMRLGMTRSFRRVEKFEHALFGAFERAKGR